MSNNDSTPIELEELPHQKPEVKKADEEKWTIYDDIVETLRFILIVHLIAVVILVLIAKLGWGLNLFESLETAIATIYYQVYFPFFSFFNNIFSTSKQ